MKGIGSMKRFSNGYVSLVGKCDNEFRAGIELT